MLKEIKKLDTDRDKMNAESVFDLMTRKNKNKQWVKELMGMGEFRDMMRKAFKEEMEEKER